MGSCPGCGSELISVRRFYSKSVLSPYPLNWEVKDGVEGAWVTDIDCVNGSTVHSMSGRVPIPGWEAELPCYVGPKGPWGPLSKKLFNKYKSYKVVEESRDHVVIDAEVPDNSEYWEFDKLASVHYMNENRVFPTAIMYRDGWIRWKGIVLLSMGAYSGDEFCGFKKGDKVKLKSGGPEMEVYSFVYSYHFKNDINHTQAWCEWENKKLQQCFELSKLVKV